MKSITELTETRWRTVYTVNKEGDRVRSSEEYLGYREIKSAAYTVRLFHLIVDYLFFAYAVYFGAMFIEWLAVRFNFSEVLNSLMEKYGDAYAAILMLSLYIFFESVWQKTPAKFLTRTVVIDEFGNKPAFGKIVLRTLIRIIPFEALSFFGGEYSRGWHDRWAKTWVVKNKELKEIKELQKEQNEEYNLSEETG